MSKNGHRDETSHRPGDPTPTRSAPTPLTSRCLGSTSSIPTISAPISAWSPKVSGWSRTSSTAGCPATAAGAGPSRSPAISRSKHVTICEVALLPGPEALRAPEWVPWQDRLKPGDLGVGDLLPTPPDDERLAPGYVLSDDPAVEETSWEIGLGRVRVLSREGRLDAAQRWYDGDHGPNAPISVAAPYAARCGSCGFYLQLAGSLRQAFGVCGNEYAPDDAQVVTVDHGCGAHSEVLVEQAQAVDELPTVFDDSEVESVAVSRDAGLGRRQRARRALRARLTVMLPGASARLRRCRCVDAHGVPGRLGSSASCPTAAWT